MQERKIGETFELNGKLLRCAKKAKRFKDLKCKSKKRKMCVFQSLELGLHCLRTEQDKDSTGPCSAAYRTDGKSVCFVNGEKP